MGSQADLEAQMARLGQERYESRRKKAEEHHLETTTPAGQWLLQNAVGLLSDELESWMKLAKSRPGMNHRAVQYLELLPCDLTAALVARTILDAVSHRKTFTRCAMQVAGMIEDEVRYITLADTDPQVWSRLKARVQEYMGYQVKRRNVVATMNRMQHSFQRWPNADKMQVGTVCIELLCKSTGLVEVVNRRTIFNKTRSEVCATDKTLRWLEESHARNQLLTPIYLPCVEPPHDWRTPFQGGFHTNVLHRRALVKSWDRRYLDELEHAEMPQLYEAVNTIQRTPFRVNAWVLNVLKDFWNNNRTVAGLPTKESLDIPPKPADIDTNKDARKAWRREAAGVYDANARTLATRLMMTKVLQLADDYRDKRMYFVAQLDWRSRCYATSFHLHPQGPDYVKACLRFAEGKPLSHPTHVRWLKIHGANCWGMSKQSFDERVQWIDSNAAMICGIGADPYANQEWQEADEPWQFLAFCREYFEWKQQGDSFVSTLPIALDATQSGVQILSLALRDPVGAEATNVVPSEQPQDLYQRVADKVTELLEAEDTEIARMWLEFGMDRAGAKRICMTRVYNAQLFSGMGYVREWAVKKAGTEKFLPVTNDFRACLYLAKKIWEAMDQVIAGAQQAMDWFGKVARICVDHELPVRWTTAIGYPVKQDYRKYRSRSIKTKIGDTVRQHKIREETDKIDGRKMVNGLAPNWVHSVDAALMFKTILKAKHCGVKSFAVVHDSFATVAADAEALSLSIREAAADIFSRDLLAEFKAEVEAFLPPGVVLPEIPEYGDLDPACVRESLYFFN